MGSGSLNAMSVFESGYKEDMTKEEAMDLVARAIRAGIYNDLGSGSNVDLCIITKDGKEYLRNYELLWEKTYQREKPVVFPPGTARETTTPSLNPSVLLPNLTSCFFPLTLCIVSLWHLWSSSTADCPCRLLLPDSITHPSAAVVKKFEKDIIPLSAVNVIEGDAMDTS